MSEPKWTPGPWRVNEYGNVIHGGLGRGESVCVSGVSIVCGYRPKTDSAFANTHLIAAAPELYDMLMEASRQIEYLHEKFAYTGSGETVLAQIEHVLAKARGAA